MEEIEVGEYVRTKNGYIIKVDERTTIFNVGYEEQYVDMESTVYGLPYEEEIVKPSKNIIDLIEVGDYVNGKYVQGKGMDGDLVICDGGYKYLFPPSIHSIVTKEQFTSMEYKVGE